MAASCIERYLQIQNQQIDSLAIKMMPRFPNYATHDIRVAIKRIRAVYGLIDELAAEQFDYKSFYRFYRKVFKTLAGLRDVQVQLRLCRSISNACQIDLGDYTAFLSSLRMLEIRSIRKRKDLFNHASIETQFLKDQQAVKELSVLNLKQRFIEHIQSRYLLVANEIPKMSDDKIIHDVRIKIKRIRYLMELYQFCYDDRVQELTQKMASSKPIENDLGDWHDQEIALEFFQLFKAQADGRKLKHHKYKIFEEKINAEKKFYKDRILTRIQSVDLSF